MKSKILNLNEKEKKMLLDLAKKTIEFELGHTKFKIEKEKIPSRLREKKATFVTLTIDGQLRGCMGHLLPSRELYLDVIENAKAAAFYDPRFLPLRKDEFSKIQIEISILSLPQKINYKSNQELIFFLEKNKPGVILKKGRAQATFLPQVWQELKKPEDFLAHLCLKAGLLPDEWKRNCEIEYYQVAKIK